MIAGTIREARSQSRDRVTTLHLFGDSDNGVAAEMREHEEWTGYEEGGYGQLGRHRKLTAVRGPRTILTQNESIRRGTPSPECSGSASAGGYSPCGGCSPESTSDYAACEGCRFNPDKPNKG